MTMEGRAGGGEDKKAAHFRHVSSREAVEGLIKELELAAKFGSPVAVEEEEGA